MEKTKWRIVDLTGRLKEKTLFPDEDSAFQWKRHLETWNADSRLTVEKVEPKLASLTFAPTTGFYTVMERGTTIVLKGFLKSLGDAADWCIANGWELESPAPIETSETQVEVIKALVQACRDAQNESVNTSGYSDDSDPVLSRRTRDKMDVAILAAQRYLR